MKEVECRRLSHSWLDRHPTPSTFSSRNRKFYRYPLRNKIRKLPSYANLGLVTGQDAQGQVLTRCFSQRVALESRLMQRVFFRRLSSRKLLHARAQTRRLK